MRRERLALVRYLQHVMSREGLVDSSIYTPWERGVRWAGPVVQGNALGAARRGDGMANNQPIKASK